MNDQERKKAAAAIFTAAAEGKVIEQTRYIGGKPLFEWREVDPFSAAFCIQVASAPGSFRVRPPEPTTRPWSKPEDVPGPVCWIRAGNKDGIAMIVGISEYGITYTGHNGAGLYSPERMVGARTWELLAEANAEYSTDRRTWHPCTVTEPTP